MPFPPQAEDSLLERLEKAHMCTERLLQRKSQLLHTKSTVTFPSSSPREAPSKRLGSCPVLEDLLDEHWTFRLERQPSTLPGAGMGLFLVQGRVHAGEVITCHPGLVYRIPYDLEACMPMDEVSFSPCPPPFLVKNDYLLRFYHPVTNQHLLLDGCPQGISALNFIAANQRRGHPWANMEWLESSPFGSRRRGPERGEGLLEGGWGEGRKDRGMPGGPMQGTSCLGEGGEEVLLPREMDSSKYFTAKLGLGHLAHAPRGRHSERGAEGPQDGQTRSWDAGRSCQHDEGGEGGGLKFNDPHSPEKYNAEFHLCELPSDLPPHLLRFIPNLHFAQGIGSRRFCVLVTASKNLEVPQGAPPVEIYVPYASSFTEVCKHGFPLL
ncbi:hypothetical protein NSK_006639 [Nannochloropsis salina CCMP1776]|uniref:Uncharacterized protein n=1 Tax=Nannochloropsis salina CCMP1776 TaxID=1027361 RepID=A0A4D9CRU1_9STRA|nr:hypothetical protein NSK_006639 [Nannochloropsis salina CCMP1776]|eukprot:TFJ81971.1 hypothetical protein NSK_006639 [Nannochloropsis salina CCMP1776]